MKRKRVSFIFFVGTHCKKKKKNKKRLHELIKRPNFSVCLYSRADTDTAGRSQADYNNRVMVWDDSVHGNWAAKALTGPGRTVSGSGHGGTGRDGTGRHPGMADLH